ncbi:hypothetical protein LSTR_LSTR004681 [Laodelphax striatellus]|uniref:Uncharacterized protein n=1 Tax=Laodelphax striatellus TaxID=195883 RepID=A0A482WUN7_LAOST|nr:hypothetical protein LSTR_LSTR004680 [Laodelphax striatellus]RZF36993.1 hypothetical protein LSTR_LSTR004681 [Laodelphax striatellus]
MLHDAKKHSTKSAGPSVLVGGRPVVVLRCWAVTRGMEACIEQSSYRLTRSTGDDDKRLGSEESPIHFGHVFPEIVWGPFSL